MGKQKHLSSDAILHAQIKELAKMDAFAGLCPRCGGALPERNRPDSLYAEAHVCVDCNVEELVRVKSMPLNEWWIIKAPDSVQNKLF